MLTTVFKYYDINPIMTLLDCNIYYYCVEKFGENSCISFQAIIQTNH